MLAAPEHGRARPEQRHTPAKASYSGPIQAAASHSATWAAACLFFSPSRASIEDGNSCVAGAQDVDVRQ